ncbi:unnamed protein product [Amaranthus hypochondriacus]
MAPKKEKPVKSSDANQNKKWNKGKQKEKLNSMVLFDQSSYEKLLSEMPIAKLVPPSTLSERLRIFDEQTIANADGGSNNPFEEPFEQYESNGEFKGAEVGYESDNTKYQIKPISVKSKRLTSEAWLYFDIVQMNGIQMAKCRNCKKTLSYKGNSGTSHLLKHCKRTCPSRHLNLAAGESQSKLKTQVDGSTSHLKPAKKTRTRTHLNLAASQSLLKIKGDVDGSNALVLEEKPKKVIFDQEFSKKELVKMVVIHEYPLSIVDHIGFRSFVKSLNDNFKMISRNTLRSDVLKLYNAERSSLKVLLERNEGRVALTIEMWTNYDQNKGYMAVTSHFIDEQWILCNRTLRFCYVPRLHAKGVLAKIILNCLSQYSLETKISSMVVENSSTSDAMMNVLMDNLEGGCLVLGGAFLHMRCSAHILSMIVKDGLEVIDHAIGKIRECVEFWMSTPKRIEKFEEACRLMNVTKSRRISLDRTSSWDSTYLMIDSSLPFKDVFYKLKSLYKRLNFDVPSDDDWTMATIVCQKLETFYKAFKVFSTRNHPTSNLYFRNVCEIKLALSRWMQNDNIEVLRETAKSMLEKFDKYWNHVNELLAIAGILDPRNKMDCVIHYFKKLYGDSADGELARVRNTLDNLFIEYQSKSNLVHGKLPSKRGFEDNIDEDEFARAKRQKYGFVSVVEEYSDEDDFARTKRQNVRLVPVKSEVDQYLESATLPEDNEFDILAWWKNNQNYPTLRKIAKDILAIPVASVNLKNAFSMNGRVVSAHRSRLHSETLEALMCLQHWMVDDVKGTFEGTLACSTVNEDCDDVEVADILDMDIDDISVEQ